MPRKEYEVTTRFTMANDWGSWYGPEMTFTPYNGEVESGIWDNTTSYAVPQSTTGYYITTYYYIENVDKSPLIPVGEGFEFKFSNVNLLYLLQQTGGANAFYIDHVTSVRALVEYEDGSFEYFDMVEYSKQDDGVTFEFGGNAGDEVISVEFIVKTYGDTPNSSAKWYLTCYQGEYNGDTSHLVTANYLSKAEQTQQGILGGIIDGFESVGNWFSGLGNTLSNGISSIGNWFGDLGSGISDVFNAIKDLPATIWGYIENGIKFLFVPSEDFLLEQKQTWNDLLADRLGAVYEVVNITFGAWEDVQQADEIDTIHIPVVTIPLLEGQEFSFGGYDVRIVPEGFDLLVTALKSIVGIVCTLMFINGLRKRYDEIMGVAE